MFTMIDTNQTSPGAPSTADGSAGGASSGASSASAVEGGDEAFAAFYADQHLPQLRRATALARTREGAADAVHEAFVDVYRHWGRLENPGAYLNRAVVNRCRDDGRRASSRDRVKLKLIRNTDTRTAAAHDATPVIADDELWQALAALPFNQRAAIVLRHFAGHSEAEIAELLDCSTGSVGPWISRGLNKIRRSISQ